MSSHLFTVYKSNRENSQPENMCDIVFEKAKDRDKVKVFRFAASLKVSL